VCPRERRRAARAPALGPRGRWVGLSGPRGGGAALSGHGRRSRHDGSRARGARARPLGGAAQAERGDGRAGAAAIGVDNAGKGAFVASRAPHRMADFAAMLAAPEVGLRGALYVEGGPEASLFVRGGGRTFEVIGSFESGFQEDDDNAAFWPIPNVLGFG